MVGVIVATEEEAAEADDIAAIKFRGINAVTNFEMNRYDVEAIMKSALPIRGAAKHLKLSLEAASAEQKPRLGHGHHQLYHFQQQQQLQLQSSPNHSSINFALCPNSAAQSQMIPCGIPCESQVLLLEIIFRYAPVRKISLESKEKNVYNMLTHLSVLRILAFVYLHRIRKGGGIAKR